MHPIPGVGLAEDSSDVSLDAALTEEQALRDFGVGQALGDEAEDVDLPSGQALPVLVRFLWLRGPGVGRNS